VNKGKKRTHWPSRREVGVLGGLILIDQLIKLWAQENLPLQGEGIFQLACNESISWGIPLQGGWFWLFWLASISALVYLYQQSQVRGRWWLVLILAGAFSNVLDRILVGCVVDYISLGSFPIFNFADVLISLGAAGFLWAELWSRKLQ